MKNLKVQCIGLLFVFVCFNIGYSQDKKAKIGCIAFYNLENLYDTIDDTKTNDEEFTPKGSSAWTSERYITKLKNMSEVISQIGDDYVKGGPAIIGFSEVENRQVLVDLINQPALKSLGYDIVHYDSPDRRGVDVALIYKSKTFKVISSKAVPFKNPKDSSFKTRDQLVVSGLFDGEPLSVIVNHWPSRRGGEKRSDPLRCGAAQLCRSLADSIIKLNPKNKVIIMGDLNDDPIDISLVESFGAKSEQKDTKENEFYNPMFKLFKDGIGSLAYRDSWNLFDQIIVSGNMLGSDKSTYKFYQAKIFNRKFLIQKDGAFAGYPLRTYAGGVYTGGYSDHFPAYIFIVKEIK